jgi:hypothetical protein
VQVQVLARGQWRSFERRDVASNGCCWRLYCVLLSWGGGDGGLICSPAAVLSCRVF